MSVIVTGGAGFIGSNLVDSLLKEGESVVVIDNLSTGNKVNLDTALENGAELIVGDIRDGERMMELCQDIKPVVIYHLAAQIDVRKSVSDPAFDASTNITGTINMLEAARATQCKRFVYASTGGAIYGEAEKIPVPESAEIKPMAGYGQSKYAAEGYCGLYQRLHGLLTISLRFGNVYGPRQDPLGEAGVIAIFCGGLKQGLQPVVYGDGRQTRDYIYIDDIVSAAIAASRSEVSGPFNIGHGKETSVLDLVQALGRHAGDSSFKPQFAPHRPGEIQRNALDPARAASKLGWQAEVGIAEGIEKTLASV